MSTDAIDTPVSPSPASSSPASPSLPRGRLSAKHRDLALRIIVPFLTVAMLIAAWWLYVVLSGVPPYILPSPAAVAAPSSRTGEHSLLPYG